MKRGKTKGETSLLTYAIAIILLGVMMVLAIAFATGNMGTISDFIANQFGGGKVNVQNVLSGCGLACRAGNSYDFCSQSRLIVFEKKAKPVEIKCPGLRLRMPNAPEFRECTMDCNEIDDSGCLKFGGEIKSTCTTEQGQLNLPALSQKGSTCCLTKKSCSSLSGSWTKEACTEDKILANSVVTDADIKDHSGQSCCVSVM